MHMNFDLQHVSARWRREVYRRGRETPPTEINRARQLLSQAVEALGGTSDRSPTPSSATTTPSVTGSPRLPQRQRLTGLSSHQLSLRETSFSISIVKEITVVVVVKEESPKRVELASGRMILSVLLIMTKLKHRLVLRGASYWLQV